MAGNEKDQANLGIALDVAVAVKELVAGNVGNEQLPVVQNFHETGHAAFGRSVAIAVAIACGHHAEG